MFDFLVTFMATIGTGVVVAVFGRACIWFADQIGAFLDRLDNERARLSSLESRVARLESADLAEEGM